ncbi:hypothetical protein E1B28_002952 [Marasmius oreades]|uniref:Uncharacterized protein n=1 Tax=Marasmius oreades TaxID=181124 RepID=A0A9P7RLJ3_9AGAR|nr:uncharacterized protein E1B28_002952 [Marasmius oreades]KAG7085390.1 hypothetical protein E1B28_002952 [Marasmius oreades]
MTVHLLFHGRDKSASFLFAFDLSPLRLLPIKAAQLLQHLRHWYRRLLELKLSIRLAPFGLVALIKQALEARSIKIRAFYVTIDIKYIPHPCSEISIAVACHDVSELYYSLLLGLAIYGRNTWVERRPLVVLKLVTDLLQLIVCSQIMCYLRSTHDSRWLYPPLPNDL